MSEETGSVTNWIVGLRAGDQAAAQPLWERYFARLVRLADAKLDSARHLGVIEDGEDAALSAIGSLFGGVMEGKYPQLADRDDLWHLLVVITARKAWDQVERARALKRGGGRVVTESDLASPAGSGRGRLEDSPDPEPSPEFAAMVLDQCRRLLDALPNDGLRDIAVWKMEGYTRQEIAGRLRCSPRTVAYKLEYIREAWETLDP